MDGTIVHICVPKVLTKAAIFFHSEHICKKVDKKHSVEISGFYYHSILREINFSHFETPKKCHFDHCKDSDCF